MRDFEQNLPMALLRAREAVMSRFRPILREHGLTEQQWRVIRALHGEDGLEVTALAEKTLLLMPSLTRILKGMEEQGWVKRFAVEGDNRRRQMRLSKSGRKLFETIAPKSELEYRKIESKLGKNTINRLTDDLSILGGQGPGVCRGPEYPSPAKAGALSGELPNLADTPVPPHAAYVYITTNRPIGKLYIGATDDLRARMIDHKRKLYKGHSEKYNLDKLVWYQGYEFRDEAFAMEARMKNWHREWKLKRIHNANPEWVDLSVLIPGFSELWQEFETVPTEQLRH